MSKKKRFIKDSKPPRGLTPEQQIKHARDTFQNVMARMGAGAPNLLEGTEYVKTRLTQNYNLLNTLYREHWIIGRIIDVIPEDMCKNWFKISSQLTPEQIDKFERLERRALVKSKILEGLKWGRLYGGAAGVILIDGQQDMFDQPLDIDAVMPGSFKGIMILDRWSGIYPETELVSDINDPEFGLPNIYQIRANTNGGTSLRIHHSRVLRFTGNDLPFWDKQQEVYWGSSVLERIYDELKKRDNTSWNIASLIFRANLNIMKMNDLGQMLASGNDLVQEQIYSTIQAQNWLMNNFSMFVMDKDDDFDTKPYSFTGLSDIYENFMLDISGAAEIPVTRLFGRSPAGLNATGESDLRNYYDSIEEKQEAYLRPVMDKLLPIMFMSEFGAIPDDLDYDFNPVSRPTYSERVDIGSKHTTAIKEVYNSGAISQRIALKELRQLKDTTGMWSNITDEDIEKASDSLDSGENVPDLGMLGGVGDEEGSLGTEKENREKLSDVPKEDN